MLIRMRESKTHSKQGSRKWMTRVEICQKYGSEELANSIIANKEGIQDKNEKAASIRAHPDAPEVAELTQYLVFDWEGETDTTDTVLESLMEAGANERHHGGKKSKKRSSSSSSSSDASSSSESSRKKSKKNGKKSKKSKKSNKSKKGKKESKEAKAQRKIKEDEKRKKQEEREKKREEDKETNNIRADAKKAQLVANQLLVWTVSQSDYISMLDWLSAFRASMACGSVSTDNDISFVF